MFTSIRRPLAFVVLLASFAGPAAAYDPPVGIPAPSFGIDEALPAHPAGWPSSEVPGYYYVDNSNANATNTNNPYGYPNRPRLSLPTSIGTWPAGTYVEVHGGPYDSSSEWVIRTSGTSANPTWLVGRSPNKPVIRIPVSVEQASYLIVDGFVFDVHRRWIDVTAGSHHVSIRNSEFSGDVTETQATSMLSVSGGGSRTTDVVLFRNKVHSAGDRTGVAEADIHGIKNPSGADRLWILENEIYHVGGDSVQVGNNRAGISTPADRATFTYIGRNLFYENGENAVDVKSAVDVIVSENEFYGFGGGTSSSGEAMVVHEEADNVWAIANTVHSSRIGLINTIGTNVWFIGNEIFNIHAGGTLDPSSLYGSGVGIHVRGSSSGGAVGNTLYDYDKGVQINTDDFLVENNVFGGRAVQNSYDVLAASENFEENYNLFADFRARIGSNSYDTLAAYRSGTPYEDAGVEGEARFVDAMAGNFRLTAQSPARDAANAASRALQQFAARYGIQIRRDIDGTLRPFGAGWDIGAWEFVSGPIPNGPTALTVQ